MITIDLYTSRPVSILVPCPTDNHDRYTPEDWAHRGFPANWWPGIRPLLAALDSTHHNDRDTRYRTDHRAITTDWPDR